MTGPDPIAARAARLEDLRGQPARGTGETGPPPRPPEGRSRPGPHAPAGPRKPGEKIGSVIARRNAGEPPAPCLPGPGRPEYAPGSPRSASGSIRWPGARYAGYVKKLPPGSAARTRAGSGVS